jgi:hypothetical protein
MVLLPEQDLTVQAIYKWYEDQRKRQGPRLYLGGSELGEECRRMLWYRFRHVRKTTFPGRVLRLFETGSKEENRIIHNLRAIGCTVHSVDPSTGRQWEYKACDDHLQTHLDGVVLGLLESPKTWHLLEIKTCNQKYYDHMVKHGCIDSKLVHWVQMQIMMGLAGLKRAMYIVQNKNTDELYTERIQFDKTAYEALLLKAKAIIFAESPPERIGKDPSFFKCRFCNMSDFCFGKEWPDVNCRTCVHSSPIENGQWSCAMDFTWPCDEHVFLPTMVQHWAEPIDGDPTWVRYRADGYEFVNCAATGFPAQDVDHYSSKDMRGGKEPVKTVNQGRSSLLDDDDYPF